MTLKDIASILHKLQTEVEKKVHEPDGKNPVLLRQALSQIKAAQTSLKRSEMVFVTEEEEIEEK